MNQELDEKVQQAIKSQLVGEINFSPAEIDELRSHIYPPYLTGNKESVYKEACYFFVLATNHVKTTHTYNLSEIFKSTRSGGYLVSYSTNEFYNYMSKVFKELRNDVVLFNSGQRYYSTFMYHALSPTSSMYAFFNLCYSLFVNEQYVLSNFNGDIDFKNYAESLRAKFKFQLNSENDSLEFGSESYDIRIGIRRLTDERPDQLAELFERVYNLIVELVENDGIPNPTNNQLICLLNNWWSDKRRKEATKSGEQRRRNPIVKREKMISPIPRVIYRLRNNLLYVNIPEFLVKNEQANVRYEIRVDGKTIKSGPMDVAKGKLYCYTEEADILIESMKELLEKIEIIIFFDEKTFEIRDCKRKFLLFPYVADDRYVRELYPNGSLSTGRYKLYCDEIETTFKKYPNDIYSIQESDAPLYVFDAKLMDTLETDDSRVTFSNIQSYEKTSFVFPDDKAKYEYKESDYHIISENKVYFTHSNSENLLGVRCFDPDDIDNSASITDMDAVLVDSADLPEGKVASIILTSIVPYKPYIIRLYDKTKSEEYKCEARIIYIPNFDISYEETLFFSQYGISFDLIYNGYSTKYENSGTSVPFIAGKLKLIDPPIFECWIGDEKIEPSANKKFYPPIWYEKISDIAALSLCPKNVDFVVYLGNTRVGDLKKFGEIVHALSNNPKKDYANMVVYYRDKWGRTCEISLMRIYFKPTFLSEPLYVADYTCSCILTWNPKGQYIGSEKSFIVKIEGSEVMEPVSLEKKTFDVSDKVKLGMNEYEVCYVGGFTQTPFYKGKINISGKYEITSARSKIYFNSVSCTKHTVTSYGIISRVSIILPTNKQYCLMESKRYRDVERDTFVYVGNLYKKDGDNWVKINELDGIPFMNIVWKIDSSSDGQVLLRYINDEFDKTINILNSYSFIYVDGDLFCAQENFSSYLYKLPTSSVIYEVNAVIRIWPDEDTEEEKANV